jgi:hypothetical protein
MRTLIISTVSALAMFAIQPSADADLLGDNGKGMSGERSQHEPAVPGTKGMGGKTRMHEDNAPKAPT